MNVNVPAMTARATPACAARADTAPSMSEPLELLTDGVTEPPVLLAAAGESDEGVVGSDENPDEDMAMETIVATLVGVDAKGENEGPLEVDVEEGAFELTLPPLRYGGAATALVGSVRAPFPQGIGWPSGWLALGGGTVAPVASAMAKRPVQVRLFELGEENW
jgi:hypothetical protein